MRAVDEGRVRVNAHHMYSALREFASTMRYTAVLPPKGLVKHALDQGVDDMMALPDDEKLKAKERSENALLARKAKDMEKKALLEKERRKQRKEELAAERQAEKERMAQEAQEA